MPYARKPYRGPKRRYRRRRRYGRRPPTYKKPVRYQVADMAYSGYKLAKKIAKWVNIEFKTHTETQSSNLDIDYDGTIITLNDVAQGDTSLTRDGDSIKCQSMDLNVQLACDTVSCVGRVIVFHDKQNTVSSATDLIDVAGTAMAPHGFKEWDHRFKTQVLWDSGPIHMIVSTDKAIKQLRKKIELNLHTQFDSGTTTIESGAIKMLLISNRANSSNEMDVLYHSRIYFTDN